MVMKSMPPLPIDAVLPELIATLRGSSSIVLRAPTGAGKTTRIPPALLDAGFAQSGRIVMIEPRRIAARAAARRMAHERGTTLGDDIGFHVRFERKSGSKTKILVVTPGILLRMLHDDPFLESVSVLLFDEFHERGLETDLTLGMSRLMQQTVRSDLKIVVMSATLDTEQLVTYLDEAPVVASEGRLFSIDIQYAPPARDESLSRSVLRAVERLVGSTQGDLLVFLPGIGEIRQTSEELQAFAEHENLLVLPLHGDLPADEQDAALLRHDRRKIVLATNVAETSVTVDGVTVVIDSGLARVMRFDAGVGLDRLQLEPISRASADQRAGRAGRLAPGVCVRLWSETSHLARRHQTEPEIQRVDLTGAILQLHSLGETDIPRFPWLNPPPEGAVQRSLELLELLGAIEANSITPIGHELARLPVHPRIGMLLRSGKYSPHTALAAALLSERDIFLRSGPSGGSATPTFSDVTERIEILEEYQRSRRTSSPLGPLNPSAARSVLQVRSQLLREARSGTEDDETVPRALLAAFPDRVCRRRERGGTKGVMVGGRGVRLAPSSGVIEPELFLAVQVDAGGTETLVRIASGIERDWLSKEAIQTEVVCEFDESSERVTACRRTLYRDLILDETTVGIPPDTEISTILTNAARKRPEKVLPPTDSAAGQWLIRVACLNQWLPDVGLPTFETDDLLEMIAWFTRRARSFDDLRRADWLAAVQSRCSYEQLQLIEREAPDKLLVPSGSHIALEYTLGQPPILAVRVQELFGLADTPRIARGRVKVLLHLLAPNYRPQQVTDDLASFWVNTYPLVRKELRARYPKHSWPDDPLTAEAIRGAKRRKPE